jgi:pilus assembly protein Flp/PilA
MVLMNGQDFCMPLDTPSQDLVAAIEYGLIAAGISVAIITAVATLGTQLNSTFTAVTSQLASAGKQSQRSVPAYKLALTAGLAGVAGMSVCPELPVRPDRSARGHRGMSSRIDCWIPVPARPGLKERAKVPGST